MTNELRQLIIIKNIHKYNTTHYSYFAFIDDYHDDDCNINKDDEYIEDSDEGDDIDLVFEIS